MPFRSTATATPLVAPATCDVAQFPLSTRAPGVHTWEHESLPGHYHYEVVAADGRRVRHGVIGAAFATTRTLVLLELWQEEAEQILATRCSACPVKTCQWNAARRRTRLALIA